MARIVVGTDGSTSGDEAVRFAASEAAAAGAVLEIIHVWPEPSTVSPGAVGAPQYVNKEPGERSAEEIVKHASTIASTVAPDVTIDIEPMAGDTVQVLCDASADADLLVIGSRGRGDLASLVRGSVSHGCLHHARCPVAVVHHPSTPGGPVVVGADGSDESATAVRYAAQAAARRGTFLHIVHAWHVATPVALGPMAIAAPTMVDSQAVHEAADEVVDRARAMAGEAVPGLEITGSADEGVAAEVIEAASKGASMVVVGSHRRGDLSALVLGSTSHGLIRNAACPVVCVPS
jgi:nucleotide-binding universal stress UspA family protein